MKSISFTMFLANEATPEQVKSELEKLAAGISITGMGRLEMQGITYLTATASAPDYIALFSLPPDYSPDEGHVYDGTVRPFPLKDKITHVVAERRRA